MRDNALLGLGLGGLLLACRPPTADEPAPGNAEGQAPVAEEPRAEPAAEAPVEAPKNEAAGLVAAASKITAVVVVDGDRAPKGELPAEALEALRAALGQGVQDDLSATTPPWDVALQFSVAGKPTFVAIPVGIDRARLNPTTPYDARIADAEGQIDPQVREVVIGEAAHEAIAKIVGPATAKEYQAVPRDEATKGPMTLEQWHEQHGPKRPDGK